LSDKGWIKVDRDLLNHWIWNDEPFSKGQAWIDLIMLADHKDHKNPYKNQIVTYKRGSVHMSISLLAKRWGWSRDKARRFLNLLEQDGMVLINATIHRTIITIVKYGVYQDKPTTNKATNRQQIDNKPTVSNTYLKNDKNVKNEKNNNASHTETEEERIAREEKETEDWWNSLEEVNEDGTNI